MEEFEIAGPEVVRWLKQDKSDPTLMIGALFDDGASETAWKIASASVETLVLIQPESGARKPISARVLTGGAVITTGPDTPLAVAVIQARSPLEMQMAELRPYLNGELSTPLDAPRILAVVRDWRQGHLPDVDARMAQAQLLKANRQWRLGARIAADWWKSVQSLPAPPADIVIHLARFLRESREHRVALTLIEDFMGRGPAISLNQRIRLEIQTAALNADIFEHRSKRRDDRYLEKANQNARHAFGLCQNEEADPKLSESVRSLFHRLDRLGLDRR